jgi:outer membrane protein assembly factor BamB
MRCKEVKEEIELYVLSGLDAVKTTEIEEHLQRCPICRELEYQYKDILSKLSYKGEKSFKNRELVDKVRMATQSPLRNARSRKKFYQLASIAASIAAALLLSIFVLYIWGGGRDNPIDGRSGTSVKSIKTIWQKASADVVGFVKPEDILIRDNMVFLLSGRTGGRFVSAANVDTGKTLWRSELVSFGYLAADDQYVYCVTLTDQAEIVLAALDKSSGQVAWTFQKAGELNTLYASTKPVVLPDNRICWVHRNTAYAIDTNTGNEIWHRTFEGEGCLSQTTVIGSSVYVANRNGVYCINDKDGQILWHLPYQTFAWPGTKPLSAAGHDKVFIVTGEKNGMSRIRCIDSSGPLCLWQRLVPRVTYVYADSDYVYLRCQHVLALNQKDGNPIWKIEATGCSPITACDDKICFTDTSQEGHLMAVNRHNGHKIWQIPGLHSCNAFVKIGERGYLKTNDSVVLAFAFDS